MTTAPDTARTAALLRAALHDHQEVVMTLTDTEHELARFRDGVRRHEGRHRIIAAAAAVALLAAGAGSFLVLRDQGPQTFAARGEGVTGVMVLDLQRYSDLGESDASNQVEARDALWTGTLTLSTADGDRSGTIELAASSGLVATPTGPRVFHSWGTATAILEGADCVGSFGSSFYREAGTEVGGALQLSCEDGSVVGATMLIDEISATGPQERFRAAVRLADGFYVEG